MTCENCLYKGFCENQYGDTDYFDDETICDDVESLCGKFKDKSTIVELPFVAMVEQDIVDGKFAKGKKYQNNNGRFAVVYVDYKKWGTPLIDICGVAPYRADEAKKRLEELRNG